jgi:hypothetical protein
MLFEKCLDVIRALSEAINIVKMGKHDPFRAHKTFYNWEEVTSRTEKVYDAVLKSRQMDLNGAYSTVRCCNHSPFGIYCHHGILGQWI